MSETTTSCIAPTSSLPDWLIVVVPSQTSARAGLTAAFFVDVEAFLLVADEPDFLVELDFLPELAFLRDADDEDFLATARTSS